MRRIDLSPRAEADLISILQWSEAAFGAAARERYETLIETALGELRANPETPSGRERPELGEGLRTYHLRSSRTRARAVGGFVREPRHLIAFEFDDERVVVLGIFHESMDLARHLPSET